MRKLSSSTFTTISCVVRLRTCIIEDDEQEGLDTILLLDDDIKVELMAERFVIKERITLIP